MKCLISVGLLALFSTPPLSALVNTNVFTPASTALSMSALPWATSFLPGTWTEKTPVGGDGREEKMAGTLSRSPAMREMEGDLAAKRCAEAEVGERVRA